MNIPTFVTKKIADENGNLTSEWQLIFDQLFSQIGVNLSNEGLVVPSQSSSNISLLTKSLPFTLVGDSTNNVLKVNLNGIFKTVTTS